MNLLFANNAATTLASGINSTTTTVVLAAGTGVAFPNPGDGQAFYMTIKDAATQLTNEIVLCTTRVADVCTVVRGRQGSQAVTWDAGDIIAQLVTEADLAQMIQPDELQSQVYTATDAAGTNSLTATLSSQLTEIPNSLAFIMRAAGANTGAVTLTLTLGTSVLAAKNVLKYGGSALSANDIPAAGYPCILIWSASIGAYILANPASGTTNSVAGGAANQVLKQTAPGTTGFVAAPTVAGQVLAFVGGVIAWAAAAVTSFNGRAGAVAPQTGDYTAAQVAAVAAAAFGAPNRLLANPGFAILPGGSSAGGDGLYIQSGNRAISPGARTSITFPHAFPHACLAVVASSNNNANVATVNDFNTASFDATSNATVLTWIAVGW